MRLDRSLLIVVLGLTVLFTMLDPPPSAALSLPAKALFWFLHIGTGMLLAVLATTLLTRWFQPHRSVPSVLVILLGGMVGSVGFAPLALAIESLWPGEPAVAEVEDWLDVWEQHGGILALLAEWLSLLPAYLASWMLIHAIPLGMQRAFPVVAPESAPAPALTDQPEQPERTRVNAAVSPAAAEPGPAEPPPAPAGTASAENLDAFLAALPPAIGQDLVAIQADLHYLQVRTTRGRAMVLASLSTAEQALGDRGLRVHRSHWIAFAHIRRLARSAAGMVLVLSDGSKVPVSRRRASEVRERLGHSFVVEGD